MTTKWIVRFGIALVLSQFVPPSAFAKRRAPRRTATAPATEIVAMPSPNRPTVSMRVLFRSGAVDDPVGKEGLTALTAYLMAEGGTVRLSSAELLAALYPMAAELDVQVDAEMTVFVGRVHRDEIEHFLPHFVEVLTRPRWDRREFERIRDDMINDLTRRLRTSDDENLGKAALAGLLFQRHPYGRPTIGTVAGLKAITIDDVKRHAARVFSCARMSIGVAGGFSPNLPNDLQTKLRALPAGTAPARVPAPPAEGGPRVLIVEKTAEATAISMGHPWPIRRDHPDFPALFVAVSAFGEHRQFNGHLMERMRGQRGLNYGDYAYVEHFRQDGGSTFTLPNIARSNQYFSIWIRPVEHPHRVFALRAALHETEKLLRDGLTDDEVERTKRFLSGYSLLFTQTDSRRLGFALDDRFYGTPDFLKTLRDRIARLTTAEVNVAIRKWIAPNRLRIAIVTQGAAELAKALVADTASPITYSTPKPKAITDEDAIIARVPLRLRAEEVSVVNAGDLFER